MFISSNPYQDACHLSDINIITIYQCVRYDRVAVGSHLLKCILTDEKMRMKENYDNGSVDNDICVK
jgi:hypothetical protein